MRETCVAVFPYPWLWGHNPSRAPSVEQPPVKCTLFLSHSSLLTPFLTRSFFSEVRSIIASHPTHPSRDVAKWNVEFYLWPFGSVSVINDLDGYHSGFCFCAVMEYDVEKLCVPCFRKWWISAICMEVVIFTRCIRGVCVWECWTRREWFVSLNFITTY